MGCNSSSTSKDKAGSAQKSDANAKASNPEAGGGGKTEFSNIGLFTPGKISDQYGIDKKKLGEGSYGSVSKAKKKDAGGKTSGDDYAVKTIAKDKNKKNELRTHSEIKIMKGLSHPNIIKLYEAFEDHRNICLVMELCSGGELFDRIIEAGHFSEAQAGHIMKQIFQALNYLHSVKSIAHRDLKPENFLLLNKDKIDQANNHLKIIDFGLSCPYEKGQILKTKAGTPYYVAPEVLQGSYNEKSDIWSCGVIMFVLHCGYPPFFGESDAEVLKKVKAGKFEFNPADWKKISQQAKDLIKDGLLVKEYNDKRLSAKQALEHSWFSVAGTKTENIKSEIVTSLQATVSATKLQKLALRAIASKMGSNKIKDLQTEFKKLDADGDGHLTLEEMKSGLKKAGVPEAEIIAMYASLDTDNSNKVDYHEFLSATIDKRALFESNILWDCFVSFDKNGDGSIDKSELNAVCDGLDQDVFDAATIDALLKEADKDGDQKISWEEFEAAVKPK